MEKKLIQYFNKFVNYEFYSAYLYFAMSTYFQEIAMMGFCDYMKHKASEKLNKASEIYNYLILRDEKLSFSKIEEPCVDWLNVTDVFSIALSCEEYILSQLNELYKTAKEGEDFPALEFILSILKDQTICVGNLRKIIFRIKNTNIISSNVEYIDGIIDKLGV